MSAIPQSTTPAERPACRLLLDARGCMRLALTFALVGATLSGLGGCRRAGKGTTLHTTDELSRPCPPRGAQVAKADINADGKADIQHAQRGGRRVCSVYDMNLDGRVDLKRFYEEKSSRVAREEHDFDFDGKIDQVAFFKRGVLVRKDLDTNFDEVIDTRIFCRGKYIIRAERDRFHTGHVNTWEYYHNGRIAKATFDLNNDRKPDKWEFFRDGQLREVRIDNNGDGKIDRRNKIPANEAVAGLDPIRCDGSPLDLEAEAQRREAAAARREAAAAGAAEDREDDEDTSDKSEDADVGDGVSEADAEAAPTSTPVGGGDQKGEPAADEGDKGGADKDAAGRPGDDK